MNADATTRHRGFTLVEVLVALAIVALGLIGVFGQLSQSAAAAVRLRDKTIADWVAVNKLTELRLSGVFPRVGSSSGDVEMANTTWHWETKVSETAEQQLRRADVTVSFAEGSERPVAVAAGFLVQKSPVDQPAGGAADTGWPPFGADGQVAGLQSPPPGPGAGPSPLPAPPPAGEPGEAEQ